MTKLITTTACMMLAIIGLNAAELDFGDHSSETLTTKAWEALSAEKYQNAIAFADKCAELHGKAATKMQAKLTDFASDTDASDYWALNDVGTCYYIKGKSLLALKKNDDAKVAYKHLVDKLKYSQCWDPNGWFWHPAEAAQEALEELK